jgi:flagellar hook-associated protein 2
MYLGAAAAGVATDPITIDATNNTFAIKINATSSSNISLAQGSYTRDTLATMLESAINNDTNLKAKGLGVTATFDSTNNRFEFVTKDFGSASKIDFTSVGATMGATLGINTGAGATGSYAGKDVMGTLTNEAGKEYTFLGTGQHVKISSFIAGAPKDLQFDVLGGATGDRGSIAFNKGYASGMTSLITKMLDSKDGLVGQRITGVETGVTKVKEDLKKLDDRYNLLVQRYTNQFGMVNALQEQMSSLASSLAASFGATTA